MRIFAVLVLASIALTAGANAAPIPKPRMKDGDNSDLRQLQGKWKLVAMKQGLIEFGGPNAADLGVYVEISGAEMVQRSSINCITGKITLDSVGGVKRLVVTNLKHQWAATSETTTLPGFVRGYTLNGDQWVWAIHLQDQSKLIDPKNHGFDDLVFVFARVKDKK